MSVRIAEQVADAVRERYPVARDVPVDLSALARMLGVDRISYVQLIEDGRLETDDAWTEVLVRRSASQSRQRFTVAHELAHLLLTRPGQAAVERRLSTDSEVERFCDQFAAALLLPRSWVRTRFGGRPEALETLRGISDASEVSLAASLVRMQQVLGWRRMLLQWKYVGGSWRYRWGAGIPSTIHGRLRTPTATREMISEVRRKTGRDIQVSLPMLVAGRVRELNAEISVRGSSAIALAEPPR